MKKVISLICCVVIMISAFSSLLMTSAASNVIYTLPFDDYDRWYTGVDGNTDAFTYGYLDSPTKFMDYKYENGCASIFMTGKTIELKAYQYGSQAGWPYLYYSYDEPIELDLTNAVLEYEVSAQTSWNFCFLFQNADETSTTLVEMSALTQLPSNSSIPHQEPVVAKGKIDFIGALRENYLGDFEKMGLTNGNTVHLKTVQIQMINTTTTDLWAENQFRTFRLIKDKSLEKAEKKDDDSYDTSSVSTSSSDGDGKKASIIGVPSKDKKAEKSNESAKTDETNADKFNAWIIVIISAVVAAGGVTAFIIIKKRKHNNG